ncbi:MAG: insulinase family protein [Desulfobacteraceae bacterium]|nr:insulinase family protein [Desulfobacteraceae bacterium]MBC2756215.1 insulinase family protein [Desulfobacteraceae bacterium]
MKRIGYQKLFFYAFLLIIFAGCSTLFQNTLSDTNTAAQQQIPDITPSEAIFNPTGHWAHAHSDLKPDPNVIFKELPNGFRYILMENSRPENRVSMHLFIQAGSMHEKENERGVAHFLEHLLFNGSENFAPGELVKYFQSIGMKFGPDANAHTGFYKTVYDIDLPKGDPQDLADALLVLKDYAAGALILEEEVENERPVILAEKRTRDSVGFRTFEATFKFELPDALLSDRLPIGTEEVIRAADRQLLKSFYDTWYRPERMMLIMAGDFDIQVAEPLIMEKFAGLSPRATESEYPDPGSISHSGTKTFYHFEPEAGNTSISIETISQKINPPDSVNQQKIQLRSAMANHIVNKRLTEMLNDPDTPFTHAMISSGNYLNYLQGADINADCAPENWGDTLTSIEQTLRKALTYGFTESEIELAKKAFTAQLDKEVKASSTRESRHLARQIMHSLNAGKVFQSPDQKKELKTPFIDSVTPEVLYEALHNNWDTGNRLVLVTGNIDLNNHTEPPTNRILDTFTASMAVPVDAPEEKELIDFPYLPAPVQKGKIISRDDIADLGIIHVEFENGVHLYIKPTDFKANQVKAALIFGNGKKGEPKENPGLAALSRKVVQLSGLGRLSRDELKRALTGKNTHVAFQVDDDHFALTGNSVTDEIPLLFQLYHAYINDPGFREDAYFLSLAQYAQDYESLKHSINGGMVFKGSRFLAGGDTRFGLPDFDTFKNNSLEDIRGWITPALANAPLEISIVGDIDPESVIDLAATYLGSLPTRSEKAVANDNRQLVFPAGESLTISVPTVIPKGLITLVYLTGDYKDIHRNRRLSVLSEIINDRMRIRIREEMGASYSSYAYNAPSRAYDDYGLLNTVVQVNPDDTDKIIDALVRITDDIAAKGVQDDELHRAVNPIIESIKERVKTNPYWLDSVLKRASRYPAQLDWCRSFQEDYAAITEQEVNDLARKYLVNSKAATVVIIPDIITPDTRAEESKQSVSDSVIPVLQEEESN